MAKDAKDMVVVLGPTASGKTALGVALAKAHGGEVISADSRQVYRGLDIGAGKDLEEYRVEGVEVPYHLIDVVDLDREYSVFEYQRKFYEVLGDLRGRAVLPVVVGGTGLYLEAVLSGYRMVDVPEDRVLREKLSGESNESLAERLRKLRPGQHNTTDLLERARMVRAIEIALYSQTHDAAPAPAMSPLILGIRWERSALHGRIGQRLRARLDGGLVEEVEGLLARGVDRERLRTLGLEYRYVADYLDGTIKNRNDLFQKLNPAIRNFAKRQETWFRRMERNGAEIHWVAGDAIEEALEIAGSVFPLES